MKAKSDRSIKNYMKADHNAITPFGVKVMWKYKVLSKREHCMIKNRLSYILSNTVFDSHNLTLLICHRSYRNTQSSLILHQRPGKDTCEYLNHLPVCVPAGGGGGYFYTWAGGGGSRGVTPIFGIFNLIWFLFYTSTQSDWLPPSAEKISLSLSQILEPKFGLIFNQNVFLSILYQFSLNVRSNWHPFSLILNLFDP